MKKVFKIISYISLVIMILLMLNSFLGDVIFRLTYINPKVKATTSRTLNPKEFPTQINIPEKEQEYIKVTTNKGKKYALKKQAEYSLTGLVVAKNTNFFLRDVMRSKFDDVCLMDLGLVWGEIADKKYVEKYLKFTSKKTLGAARQLSVKSNNCQMPYKWNYVSIHMGHTHIIPASINVMSAMLTIKKYDVVKLDGYLVDIYTDKGEVVALTSLSRSDTNNTSRGYGACEDMYVEQVQIGNKIYR